MLAGGVFEEDQDGDLVGQRGHGGGSCHNEGHHLMETFRRLQNLFACNRRFAAGARGETAAADYLCRHGFYVLARNWRSPRDRRDEIDLVCRDGGALVFVEVKARAENALVPGYFAVDGRKRRVLRRAIRCYLGQLRRKPHTFRFDIVEVALTAGPPEIRHFENVELFSKHDRSC
jgi:putative endonuclease